MIVFRKPKLRKMIKLECPFVFHHIWFCVYYVASEKCYRRVYHMNQMRYKTCASLSHAFLIKAEGICYQLHKHFCIIIFVLLLCALFLQADSIC